MTAPDLYADLTARYPAARPNRRGEVFIPCPWCGKEGKHFSFSPRGGHCFVCGQGGSLATVAAQLGMRAAQPYTPPAVEIRVAAPWQREAAEIIARSLAHPDRLARWAAYKPLKAETLNRHQFGLGKLPFQRADGSWYWSQSEWLTVPLYAGDQLVGLRGRNLGSQGPKWISATGTRYVLWNLAAVTPGSIVWICENYVDAAWLMERHPDFVGVALGGATTWQAEWAEALAARRPRLVVVATDNDLAGQATGAALRRLQEAWQVAHPQLAANVPQPNGPKIANSLLAAGCAGVSVFRWPATAPDKADIGWLLANE